MNEPRRRQPLTITDEGDGLFILSCGDGYTIPDYRWNIIGLVMEWFLEGEDVDHFETAEEHKRTAMIIEHLNQKHPFRGDDKRD